MVISISFHDTFFDNNISRYILCTIAYLKIRSLTMTLSYKVHMRMHIWRYNIRQWLCTQCITAHCTSKDPFFDNGLFKNYTVRNSAVTDSFFDDAFFWRYKLCIIAHLKIQSSTMAYRRYIFLQSLVYTLQESWYFVHNSAFKDMFIKIPTTCSI